MGFYEFPHTRNYDSDLGFLIKLYKELLSQYSSIQEAIKGLEKDIEKIKKLDLTDECRKIINEMLESGRFEQLIAEYFENRAVPSSCDISTLQSIYRCIHTYLDHQHEISYITTSEGHNSWDYENGPEVITNPETGKTGWAIQCSNFVHLITYGVRYIDSMYNQRNQLHNRLGGAGYMYDLYKGTLDGHWRDFRFVRDMLPEYIRQGLAEPTNEHFSNIKPGDILFFNNTFDGEPSSATHVGIILSGPYCEYQQGTARGIYLLAEAYSAYNTIKVAPITCQQLETRGVFYVARPVWGPTSYTVPELLAEVAEINNTYTPDITDWNLKQGDIITLDFDFTPNELATDHRLDMSLRTASQAGTNRVVGNPLRWATQIPNIGYQGEKMHFRLHIPLWINLTTSPGDTAFTYLQFQDSGGSATRGAVTNFKIYRGLA